MHDDQATDPLSWFDSSLLGQWHSLLLDQTVQAMRPESSGPPPTWQIRATAATLLDFEPKDVLEAMLVAQLTAAHNAAMECHRRAMIDAQTFAVRQGYLNQANKLSRSFAMLLEALNRHRGKGQQKVTVEHVHVHSGGQAVVGVIEPPAGGDHTKREEPSHAKQVASAPQPKMQSADKEREPVPIAGDAKRPLPNARRHVARRSKGE
jgi:hypothetical protein